MNVFPKIYENDKCVQKDKATPIYLDFDRLHFLEQLPGDRDLSKNQVDHTVLPILYNYNKE